MPLFLEPDQHFSIVLESDTDKPIESRPVFFAKSQPMRTHSALLLFIDTITDDCKNADDVFAKTCTKLREVVIGWEHMGDAFDFDLLSFDEAKELLRRVANNQHVSNDEKKS